MYAQIVEAAEKPKLEPAWRGPLEIERSDTDRRFVIAYGVFILIWIIIAIYAFAAGEPLAVFFNNTLGHVDILDLMTLFSKHLDQTWPVVLGFSAFSLALLCLFVVMLRWSTRILIWIMMGLFTCLVLFLYFFVFWAYFEHSPHITMPLIIVVLAFVYGVLIYAFIKIGITTVCKVIKESCKAMFFFPSTIILMLIQFVLQILLVTYAGAVYGFLKTIRVEEEGLGLEEVNETALELNSNETFLDEVFDYPYYYHPTTSPFYVYCFHVYNLIGYLWTCQFITGLGRMILTVTFATWYSTSDKSSISIWTLPKSLSTVVKCHLGTIAYASSLASIVPCVISAWEHGREKFKLMYKRPILIFSWILMFMKSSFDALSMCAIHGKGFYHSLQDSYTLLMKYPISYIAINTLCECIIFLGTLLIPILSLLSAIGYCQIETVSLSNQAKLSSVFLVMIISFLMCLSLLMVFRAASNTIRYCFLEDSKFSQESEMNMYEMHKDDLSIRDFEP